MPQKDKLRLVPATQKQPALPPITALPLSNHTGLNGAPIAKKTKQNKKAHVGKPVYRKGDLWIAESSPFKRNGHHSDWRLSRAGAMDSNRFLDLADIALGHKLPEARKKRRTG
jgi:hypothetical protein